HGEAGFSLRLHPRLSRQLPHAPRRQDHLRTRGRLRRFHRFAQTPLRLCAVPLGIRLCHMAPRWARSVLPTAPSHPTQLPDFPAPGFEAEFLESFPLLRRVAYRADSQTARVSIASKRRAGQDLVRVEDWFSPSATSFL